MICSCTIIIYMIITQGFLAICKCHYLAQNFLKLVSAIKESEFGTKCRLQTSILTVQNYPLKRCWKKNVLTRNWYRFNSLIKLCICIHNFSTALYLELAALALPALVLFLFTKYTCSTVKGPINLLRFLAPSCHFIWWFLCTLFDVKLAAYISVSFALSVFCVYSCKMGNKDFEFEV